jgi:ribosomal protein S18 acetylase RimI-like enzyme
MPETLRTPSKSDLIAAIETNFCTQLIFWQQSSLQGVNIRQQPDAKWLKTGLPHPMFNIVTGARFPADDVDTRIEATLAQFQPQGIPFNWWIGPLSEPADLGRKLEDHGLKYVTNNAGMAAELETLQEEFAAPASLTIKRVASQVDLEMWLQVAASSFRIPEFAVGFMGDLFSGLGHDFEAPMQHFVAFLKERPVACATVFLDGSVAGIYTVGTIIEARRQGIGTAVTLAALQHARQAGYRYGILHASAAGLNVYRRLGFKEYCPISIYVWSGEERN